MIRQENMRKNNISHLAGYSRLNFMNIIPGATLSVSRYKSAATL